MASEDNQNDLVDQVFEQMRHAVAESGRKIPGLQRPPRRKAGWQGFERPSTNPTRNTGVSGHDGASTSVLGASASETPQGQRPGSDQNVVRDRAGTAVPNHLLRDRGIRINRRYDRSPKTLGSVLANQIIERGWQRHIAHGVIMTEWESIVGDVVSEHTRVREFTESTLIIDCESTAWATQLRYLQGEILKIIAERVGDGVVTELKIYGPKPPKMYKGRLRVKGRGPRDTYG